MQLRITLATQCPKPTKKRVVFTHTKKAAQEIAHVKLIFTAVSKSYTCACSACSGGSSHQRYQRRRAWTRMVNFAQQGFLIGKLGHTRKRAEDVCCQGGGHALERARPILPWKIYFLRASTTLASHRTYGTITDRWQKFLFSSSSRTLQVEMIACASFE